MKTNRSQLKFHETFQPEITYVAKILNLASQNFVGSKFDISELTGIPTGAQKGKVEPHIKYASYMGLLDYTIDKGNYSLKATTVGKEIFVQDRFLHENLTHWLCHYGLSRVNTGAPQWVYLVRYGHSGFMQKNTSDYHVDKANALFETTINSEEMFGVVKRCYMDGFLSDINYVKWNKDVEYVEHYESEELTYVYAYVILDSWERLFPQKREISLLDLINVIGLGKVFNLCDKEVECVIDSLADKGILKLNRQLYPLTIIATATLDMVIPQIYSCLL